MREYYEKKLKSELVDIVLEYRKEIGRLMREGKLQQFRFPKEEEE